MVRKIIPQNKVMKPVKKPKKKTSPKHPRDRCLTDMQRFRKLECFRGRVYYPCISCGKPLTLEEAQGGHFITRQNRATEIEPDNIWPQCSICNCLKHGNYHAYEYNLRKLIGDKRVDRLINMAMAKEGSEEAFSMLSEEDREKVTMKRTGKWYEAESTRIRQRMKEIEND